MACNPFVYLDFKMLAKTLLKSHYPGFGFAENNFIFYFNQIAAHPLNILCRVFDRI